MICKDGQWVLKCQLIFKCYRAFKWHRDISFLSVFNVLLSVNRHIKKKRADVILIVSSRRDNQINHFKTPLVKKRNSKQIKHTKVLYEASSSAKIITYYHEV